MNGRKLNIQDAKKVLKSKGCGEVVLQVEPPLSALTIPRAAQRRMGIKSWGLVDFLQKQKTPIIKEK